VVSEKVERIGNFLFRRRSYIPWFLVVFFWKALISPEYIREKFGIFWEYIFEIFCISISLIGIIVRLIIAGKVPEGTSGRNTKEQKAESLNTTGLYSIVRHPIYVLGNFSHIFRHNSFPSAMVGNLAERYYFLDLLLTNNESRR